MIRSLDDAVRAGEPLIDIAVSFKEGVDYDLATAAVNALGPDIELDLRHWYGSPRLRIGQVTAEGALRLFAARVVRVPLERWNPESRQHEGVWSDQFRWSATKIAHWPDEIAPYVQSIGITQPGTNDDGQAYVRLSIDRRSVHQK
jgi:hypothetical protein